MNSMANWVMRHLLDYSCSLYTGFEDQVKMLTVLEIWKALHTQMKHTFNDKGSVKPNMLTRNMRLNNNAIALGSKNVFLT